VLRALLWRVHGADGGGRCVPSYEKIAAAARCARSSVAVALKQLEDARLLTWVNRIARIRRQERDLFGHIVSVWQVIRTSNAYRFTDPLKSEPGRRVWCKSENRTGPQNRDLKSGARLAGAQVQGERGSGAGAKLSAAEHAALIARLDNGGSKADWELWSRELGAMLGS
jgi:hypothetical protein